MIDQLRMPFTDLVAHRDAREEVDAPSRTLTRPDVRSGRISA